MKKISVRKVDWRIFIVNLIAVVVPLYFIVTFAYKIQNTTTQTVFIIATLSILGVINFIIVKKGTYLIDIILKENEVEILKNNKVLYISKYADIENYNTYYFINKRGGYILRFKDKENSFCSLLTWVDFSKVQESDIINYGIIKETLEKKIPNRKKNAGYDYILKVLSFSPFIFLAIAILALIGIFVYLFFYLK